MKKIIFLFSVSILSLGLSTFARQSKSGVYFSTLLSTGLSFNKIVVEDDIDVVVYENATSNILFDGSKENIDKVEWKIKKGVLYLKSRNGSLKNKVLVTIDVSKLTEINIAGSSHIRSLGNLNSAALDIYMNASSSVAIRNTGAINLICTEDADTRIKEKNGDISVR